MDAPRVTLEDEDAFIFVHDRRSSNAPELKIPTGGLFTFADFRARICSALSIPETESFVIATTNRDEICNDDTWDLIDKGDTLYVLKSLSQELCAPTEERVSYLPHYDTIVKGGMYEYYASEGQNPLPYAFAELIDNSLAATADSETSRDIEIRLHFDDSAPQRSCIVVIDNGKGMTPRQLNNWAIYRLSKFIRREKNFKREEFEDQMGVKSDEAVQPHSPVARYMNSDISYFGVGGKQAIFFIGSSTRMISKPKDSFDVHELVISKEEFEKREKNNLSIYSGFIHNRKPGDVSHVGPDEEITARLIAEEHERESFTAVVINNISTAHIPYLKQHFPIWTRQLAHIYHFYLHGPDGNVKEKAHDANCTNIKMTVKLFLRGQPQPKVINLHDIEDDMQTLFARTAACTFEFKAIVDGSSAIEGLLRYHPFLYDRETFPSDAFDPRVETEPEDDHGYAINEQRARGKRPIFECYWNGRLIPYTLIEDFDWCALPKKNRPMPVECYNRISGILWTNDSFQVSTNKLTFLDLEMKLKDKNTVFTHVVQGHDKRTQIDKEFTAWLKECHEKHDKQILFSGFQAVKARTDVPRQRQYPWSFYTQVEWDGRVFKKGQMTLTRDKKALDNLHMSRTAASYKLRLGLAKTLEEECREYGLLPNSYQANSLVKIHRSSAPLYGTIQNFMLSGDYEGDVFATGGEVEIVQEPVSLYDEKKVVPLSKLDRTASQATIKYYIDEELAKLPSDLLVSWPNGMEVEQNEKRPAGKTIGDIKVEISNRKGELVSKLPGSSAKKLLVELKVIWHSPQGDEIIVSHLSQHGKNWPYWFRKMDQRRPVSLSTSVRMEESSKYLKQENMKNLGNHTIQLQTVLNESGANTYAGYQLPSHKIKFVIAEGEAERFTVGLLEGPFKVGVPFSIPLEFQDKYRNPSKPPAKLKPNLTAEGLELSYEGVQARGSTLFLKNVTAIGTVPSNAGKNFSLVVSIDDMKESHSLKIRLLPGPPATLEVSPKDEMTVENGSSAHYNITVFDAAGNSTGDGRQVINIWFADAPGLPMSTVNTSNTGVALLTTAPISLKKLATNTCITAKFELQNHKGVPTVERKLCIQPSGRACVLQVFRFTSTQGTVLVQNDSEIVDKVGEQINGLSFRLLDEAEQEITITEKVAGKVKVNWVPKLSFELLTKGQLPNIKVPTSISDTKYCLVSVLDSTAVECHFSVRGEAAEASRLSCQVEGVTVAGKGKVMPFKIKALLTDTYGNPVKIPDSAKTEFKVSSEDLEKESVILSFKENCMLVENVKFDTQRVGVHRLSLSYKNLEEIIPCEVISGPPEALEMPDWNPEMPVTVYADNKLPFPVKVQLLDLSGSPSFTSDVRVHITKDPKIKLIPAPQPIKTNSEGFADFGLLSVSGPTGVFEFQAKATINRTVLSGPKIRVSIQPDPMKPRKLQVDCNKNATFIAGQKLTEFRVKVIAEDNSLLSTTTASHLSMKIWKADSVKQNTPPARAISFSPDTPDKSSTGVFTFRNHVAPTKAGDYSIMFVYFDNKHEVYSSVMLVKLKAGAAATLVPLEASGIPTVSNTHSAASRCLLRFLKLQLQDKYGNWVEEGYNGEIIATVTGPSASSEVPLLVGGTRSFTVSMKKGEATLQQVMIQENSPGKDGMEYKLSCKVSCSLIPRNENITYDIPFLFYNDAKKQSQMAALSKERENLQNTIQAYKAMFQTQRSLVDELRTSVYEAAKEEQKLRAELRKQSIPGAQLQDRESVEKLIALRVKERDQLLNKPRRSCGLTPAPDEPDVLGKIGHLAMIENGDIARVISWHMSADMDCVITFTAKKAQEIYSKTQGRQQVLPLDSIFRKNLPDWGKSLPHVRYRPNWKPPGRPVYARDLLLFPVEQESCQLVFGMLLGDTLILDNLDNANAYRQEVIKYSHCPTILTWQGDRIRSNGKFGGTMNKAVPLEKLRGAVFGEPLPMSYHALCTQIASLEQYKSALTRHVQTQDELQEVISAQKNPEMTVKYKECQEAENQLAEVERQLGVGLQSKSRVITSSPSRENGGPTPTKRARVSTGNTSTSPLLPSTLNGSPDVDPSVTPTRTSLRIKSMTTVVSDDGRKKLRKT